jgi:hypothetical protein
LKRLKKEIDKLQAGAKANAAEPASSEAEPNRVSNAALFSRIHAMQKKGGAVSTPLV